MHTSPMDCAYAVEIEELDFAYTKQKVLRNIHLHIKNGCFCALLGPNGSGKSTLLHLIAGALCSGKGTIQVLGRNIRDWHHNELARAVAVVPQRFELTFPFTVEEVVLLGRVPYHKMWAIDTTLDLEIAYDSMLATGISHLGHRHISELSGGELKRVMVARALAQEPKVLLLDEPAAHLDIRYQVELYELIDHIRQHKKITVITAIHDLNLASTYCNYFVLLKQGNLVSAGNFGKVMTYQQLRKTFEIDIYVALNEVTGNYLFAPMIHRINPKTNGNQINSSMDTPKMPPHV